MATSIDDLLTALDHTTAGGHPENTEDAARALHYCARILTRLETDGLGADLPGYCARAVRHLAGACGDVAAAFEQQPGRVSELAGALGDAIGTLHRELTETDRWIIAARLAPVARRCAASIRDCGPYQTVPEILAVSDRCRELQRAVASEPPRLNVASGLDIPIPSTYLHADRTIHADIANAVGALLAEFRRNERPPATVRELVAVCHVAARLAETLIPAASGRELAVAWTNARETIGLFSDGIPLPPPGVSRTRILQSAMRIESALRRLDLDPSGEPSAYSLASRSSTLPARRWLVHLAGACRTELVRIGPTLVVPPGPRSLSDDRIHQWLRHESFRATPPDIHVAVQVLAAAAVCQPGISCRMATLSM